MESLFHAVAVLAVLFVGFQQGAVVAVRPYTSVLTVPNGQRWGTWRCPEMCPDQYFAIGFSTRVESKQRKGDDTAMNGIRLICGKDGNHNSIHTVESHPGFWGDWSNPQYCPSGVLSSFQLRVEGRQGMFGDDTAVNNIRFRCSSSPELEGPGQNWGDYGGWSQVCVNGAICGIETKVEERQGSGDNTALNDVRFRCCARAQQSLFRAVAVLAVLSVGFQQGAVVAVRSYTSVLSVTNGERYGTWRWPEMCPDQFFAVGFSTRVESNQGRGDNTAMNGIRLHCAKEGNHNFISTVESHPGYWGDWSNPQYCPSGVLTSFQLRVETHQDDIDDTAVNNIRFRCSSNHVLEGRGLYWGDYGHWSQNCGKGGICGIQTKVEERQGRGDNTALNDVRFLCCDRVQQ